MSTLPTGTVTFLFTDIEGSTKHAQAYPENWDAIQKRHHILLRSAIGAHQGHVFQIIGDAFCAAFPTASEGLQAAIEAQHSLQKENWGNSRVSVRMGLHTGAADATENGYQGFMTMALVQRIMSAAHGGQILISNSSAALIREQFKEGVSLRDMHDCSLKGILIPEHLWQAVVPGLQQDFPPLSSLNMIPNNLPVQVTSFIGREEEIKQLRQAIVENRLVTLTGSGGTGKTRLSLRVADELLDAFKDGVWFIELAPLTNPALLTGTVASVLGVREEAGRAFISTLTDWLKERDLLIILDNCEHLVEAYAQFAEAVLRSASKVRILASSREALGISGELSWRVPSLQAPDPKMEIQDIRKLEEYAAVRLFIERAKMANRAFALNTANARGAAQICSRLDGIQLAIEMAAARVNVLNTGQIAERLNDRFRLLTGGSRTALPRQQTLRAMIDWSYDLLTESERLLLRRLAVFSGGWTLELAEQVCAGEKVDQEIILELLARLVDKSLVAASEGVTTTRYRMLETVRQYTREKLFDSGEGEMMRDRHLQAFIDLAERAEPEIRGADQVAWLDRLDEEIDNLRAALEWSQEREREAFLRLASALWRFWDVRAYIDDLDWLPRALAATEDLKTVMRSRGLAHAGVVAWNHGDAQNALRFSTESEVLSSTLNDKASQALALHILGTFENDPTRAAALFEHALKLAREIGDAWLPAGILYALAESFLYNHNDLASAKSFFELGLKEAHSSGDKRRIIYGLISLGDVALAQGDATQAEIFYQEGFTQAQEISDRGNIWGAHFNRIWTKIYLEDYAGAENMIPENFIFAQDNKRWLSNTYLVSALIDLARGQTVAALEKTEAGLRLARQTPGQPAVAGLSFWQGETLRRKGDFAPATSRYREALSICRQEKSDPGYCICLEGAGMLAIDRGKMASGALLFGAREHLRASTFVKDYFPFMERERVNHLATARQQLGEEGFQQAWVKGAAMPREQVLDLMIEETE